MLFHVSAACAPKEFDVSSASVMLDVCSSTSLNASPNVAKVHRDERAWKEFLGVACVGKMWEKQSLEPSLRGLLAGGCAGDGRILAAQSGDEVGSGGE